MPRANTVFIGRLPPGPRWRGGVAANGEAAEDGTDSGEATGETPAEAPAEALDETADRMVGAPQILDWDRSHPILANVELGDVVIANSLVLQAPIGGTLLIDSTDGPIAAIAPRDAYQDAILGFELLHVEEDGTRSANTNWWNRLSFPTFWLNTLEYLAGGAEDARSSNVSPGEPVEVRSRGDVDVLTVIDPDKSAFTIRRAGQDVFQFHDTQKIGVYDVRRQDQVMERFAVNLFDRQESDIRVRPSQSEEGATIRAAGIRIGHVDVSAVGSAPARKELWKLVLFAALAVLIFEWYIYNRRVYL
jgi:hypothetical protein